MEWFPNPKWLSKSSNPRVLLISGILCWSVLTLLTGLTPADSAGRFMAAVGASWVAQGFAAGALLLAALSHGRGNRRLPWALFGGAVALRLAGEVSRDAFQVAGLTISTALQVAILVLSYTLFFVALVSLVTAIRREMVSVAVPDTLAVMLTCGLLIWYFGLRPGGDLEPFTDLLAVLARPVLDLGLLFLGLAALLTVRPPVFVVMLVGGLALFVVADVVYLWARFEYEFGGPVEALWSGGVMLLGFAVLGWGAGTVGPVEHVGNYGVALFWFGPFSPLLQYGALLVWMVFQGPVDPMVLLGGAALAVVLSGRMYAISHAWGALTRRQAALAREVEQGRILRELHDTVKQGVHGTALMIEAATLAEKDGDERAVRDLLGKALETSRETGHELSKPLDELRLLSGHAGDARTFFREQLRRFGERFGMRTSEDLQAPLGDLSREELSVAHRVFTEAVWNAAKHSGAKSLLLETCCERSSFVLRLRDDGRGFEPGSEAGGYGMRSMASRAEEAGARLEVFSKPGEGTTVELRFGR